MNRQPPDRRHSVAAATKVQGSTLAMERGAWARGTAIRLYALSYGRGRVCGRNLPRTSSSERYRAWLYSTVRDVTDVGAAGFGPAIEGSNPSAPAQHPCGFAVETDPRVGGFSVRAHAPRPYLSNHEKKTLALLASLDGGALAAERLPQDVAELRRTVLRIVSGHDDDPTVRRVETAGWLQSANAPGSLSSARPAPPIARRWSPPRNSTSGAVNPTSEPR